MATMLWEECDLYKCLGALELHNRIIAMGLDGSTSSGHATNVAIDPIGGLADFPAANATSTASPLRKHNAQSRSTSPAAVNPSSPRAGGGGQSDKDKDKDKQPPVNNRLSRLLGGGVKTKPPTRGGGVTDSLAEGGRGGGDDSNNTARADSAEDANNNNNNNSEAPYDVMHHIRRSLFDSPALATVTSQTAYYKFFLRSVLWRIYLRLLPFPYTGTAREKVVEDWPSVLFRCRAWYGGQRQQFLHCYPAHTYVAHDCAEFEPQNNLRTFSHYAERAAAASDPFLAAMGGGAGAGDDEQFGGGASAAPSRGVSYRRSTSSAAFRASAAFRGSTAPGGINGVGGMGGGMGSAGFSQSYTNGSCLDGGPQSIRDDIITMDIKRTYVSADHEVPHHTLFMILAVWRWQNPLVGYQQGMHEIAGNILLMLKRACEGVPRGTPPEVAQCANLAYVEADAYMIFDAFMNELGLAELFAASSAANQQNATGRGGAKSNGPSPRGGAPNSSSSSTAGGGQQSSRSYNSNYGGAPPSTSSTAPQHNSASNRFSYIGGGGGVGDSYDDDPPPPPSHELTTLEAVCHHIVFDLLKDHSIALFNHFANTNVLDQLLLFLPRWVRNMFTREMTRPQVFAVWDGILAVYYADVVSAAITAQERDAARRAAAEKAAATASKSMFGALRQSMRFGGGGGVFKAVSSSASSSGGGNGSGGGDASQFRHFISASDGNTTLGSFSPPLTDMAYVGEAGVTPNKSRKKKNVGWGSSSDAGGGGGGGGASSGGDDDDDESGGALGQSYSSAISISTAAAMGMGMGARRGIGRRVGGFLRTIAGVAVELLLYLEEDLVALADDFSQLKRLTRTPLLPSTADALDILLRATKIAHTRPRGLVLRTLQSGEAAVSATGASPNTTIGQLAGRAPMNNFDENGGVGGRRGAGGGGVRSISSQKKRSTMSAHHAAQNSRLTREELLEQQKSVALVIANAAHRLRTIMAHNAPPGGEGGDGKGGNGGNGLGGSLRSGDYSSISHRDKESIGRERAQKPFTISPEEVAQLQGVLLELEHLTDKLV